MYSKYKVTYVCSISYNLDIMDTQVRSFTTGIPKCAALDGYRTTPTDLKRGSGKKFSLEKNYIKNLFLQIVRRYILFLAVFPNNNF